MVNKPKNIGTAAESAVVKYLCTDGFPSAERRALRGILDAGDIAGTPGVCWEIKGGHAAEGADYTLLTVQWLNETLTEQEIAGADIGVLVCKRKGVGPSNAGAWWAWLPGEQFVQLATRAKWHPVLADLPPVRMTLAQVVYLLRSAGYGDPITESPDTERETA